MNLPARVDKRLGPRGALPHLRERNARIIALYRSGLSLREVGNRQEPKITHERVRQIIWKYGRDAHRPRFVIDDATLAVFSAEYEAGATCAEIANRHGVDESSVTKKLRGMGINMRQGGRLGPRTKTVERVKAAFRLRAQGKKWREIAAELRWRSGANAWTACHRHPELVP
jgi:transposase